MLAEHAQLDNRLIRILLELMSGYLMDNEIMIFSRLSVNTHLPIKHLFTR